MPAFERFGSTLHLIKARALLIIGILSLVSACNHSYISKPVHLGSDGGHLTDAKSRVLLSQRPSMASRPGAIYPRRIRCVEPHPDVATVVANSFSAGDVRSDRSRIISQSQAQGLAQIAQRTASIQALQRLMFRACEAYANGAITGTGYSLLLSEINKTIVTLILGETAGGRFGQSGASIGGKASATASVEISELRDMLNELQESQGAVEEAAAELQESAEKADTTTSAAAEDGAVTPLEAEAVNEANQEVKQDTEDLAEAAKRMELITKALTAADAEITKVEGLGQRDVTPSGEVASVLSMMQQNFLSSGDTQNYISACLVELGLGSVALPFSDDIFLRERLTELSGLFDNLTNLWEQKSNLESQGFKSNPEKMTLLDDRVRETKEQIADRLQTLSSSNLVEVQTAAKEALKGLAGDGEDGINFSNLSAFVYRIYHLNRKTGLYKHCEAHLKKYLDRVNDLKQKDIKHTAALKEKMVDALVGVIGAMKDEDVAKFAFCHLLPDALLRRECIAALKRPSVPPQKPVSSTTDVTRPNVTPKDDLPAIVSVAHQMIRGLEVKLPNLVAQLSKLNAFRGDKIKAPSHAKPEELAQSIKKRFEELVEAQAKLKKNLLDTATKNDSVKTTVMNFISSAPNQLNKLLELYNVAVSDQTRADPEDRKLIKANIKAYVVQVKALGVLAKTRVSELEKAIKDVANLVTRIEQHNAAVDAFKTS